MAMELERCRRKDCKEAVGAENLRSTSIHEFPDDLLWRILLCLDSPICLIRAACACKRWRRVVTGADEGRAFLRLASSIHPPTVAGQYHNKRIPRGCEIRFVPSASSPPVSSFSVDFLDENNDSTRWCVADCHGGLLLVRTHSEARGRPRSLPNLIVYDPLTRQYWPISRPPPPNEQVYSDGIIDTFLLDGDNGADDDGNISISNFRVLHRLRAAGVSHDACVFSTANGGEWEFLGREEGRCRRWYWQMAGRTADGSLYMGSMIPDHDASSRLIAIDSTSLVSSKVDLPTRLLDTSSWFTLVCRHGGAGAAVGVSSPSSTTSIVHVRGEKLELFCQVHGMSGGEWVLEHRIPNLSVATRGLSICLEKMKKRMQWETMVGVIAVDGSAFAILSARVTPLDTNSDIDMNEWFFSFDVDTMELRVLPQVLYRGTWKIFNYTLPWPRYLRACPCS